MDSMFLILVLFLVLGAEFMNGWTDAPNAIATVISTRTLSPRKAILLATALNIVGSFCGTAVATTIGKGIVSPETIDLLTVGAAMSSIIIWGLITWYLGLPTSKSHALIASLTGAAFAKAGSGALLWDGWHKVIVGLFFSTIVGAIAGWLVASLVQKLAQNSAPSRARKRFARLQILSAAFMAFSHGSNDGQKFIGVFSMALVLGGVSSSFTIPYWVIFLCALTMGLGTSMGGMRIIKTMGYKMLRLDTYQGFSAEAAAGTTILMASAFGIPLSTTHTISTSILGVGVARNASLVRWGVVRQIGIAWLVTFPFCGLLAYIVAHIARFFAL